MSEDICPRRHTCAVPKCPENWRECGVPNILNTVSEWLYGDKYIDDSEFTTNHKEKEEVNKDPMP